MSMTMNRRWNRLSASHIGRLSLPLLVLATAACAKPEKAGPPDPVAPQNASMRNSGKFPAPPPGTAMASMSDKVCYWNDKKYSDGATVCDAKMRYKCWTTKWVDIGNC